MFEALLKEGSEEGLIFHYYSRLDVLRERKEHAARYARIKEINDDSIVDSVTSPESCLDKLKRLEENAVKIKLLLEG